MMKTFCQFAEDLPFFSTFTIDSITRSGGRGVGFIRGFGTSHVRPPYCIDTEIFIQNHEKIVEPSFTETLMLEVCVIGVSWVRLSDFTGQLIHSAPGW